MFDDRAEHEASSTSAKCVEDISCCIVREYLSRKGLRNTLSKMDQELPRGEGCFSARDQLIRAAFMERLVRDNKARDSPFRALLEMLVCERLQKKGVKPKRAQTATQERNGATSPTRAEVNNNTASSNYLSLPPKRDVYQSESSSSLDSLDATLPPNRTPADTDRPQSARGRRQPGGFVIRRPSRSDIESVHKLISKSQQYREPHRNASAAMQRMEEALKGDRFHDGEGDKLDVDKMLGKYASSVIMPGGPQLLARSSLHNSLSARNGERGRTALRPDSVSAGKPPPLHVPRVAAFPSLKQEPWTGSEDDPLGEKLRGSQVKGSPTLSRKTFLLRSQSAPRLDSNRRILRTAGPEPCSEEGPGHGEVESAALRSKAGTDDIEISDVTDQETCIDRFVVSHKLVNFRPITVEEATELKQLLFGSPDGKFGEEWASQGFTFTKSNAVPYGLLQKKGGPCGVLAAVQAYMLKELLWPGTSEHKDNNSFEVDVPRRNAALARALAYILWQAGDFEKAVVVNPSGVRVLSVAGPLTADGITETLTVSTFTSKTALQDYYSSCVFKLQEENCSSCVSFLISVVITHGFERIRGEMDEQNSCLIGKHSHCNQEVVNLLLVGRAVTNVFNDEVSLGKEEKTVLRGITSVSNIGLLSLYEHYNSCQVGSYYKDPRFPIWIVLSESHFSVLFSKCRLALDPGERQFELYYYDGLNKQDDEIRLTVDPNAGVTDDDIVMTPPLELCIRTRWKGASVSWNNVEPLL
ncbi:putative ubiquitin carboxyl-terminal hydrolase MINDY-4 isoform X1 [Ixodes scapularis]